MADIGAQENPIVGHHPKNAIKLVQFESLDRHRTLTLV